jgi:hypothetical protein
MGSASGGGGGVFNTLTLTINNSVISDNNAPEGAGGGILSSPIVDNQSDVEINQSTISGNMSGNNGAGIVNNGILAEMEITGSTISGNSVSCSSPSCIATAGGIENFGGIIMIENSTITGNSATCDGDGCITTGGGLQLDSVQGDETVEILSSTISNNSVSCAGNNCSEEGGGINSAAIQQIQNTIIAGNISMKGSPDCSIEQSDVEINESNNLIGNNSGCQIFVNNVNGDIVGTSENPVDAKLGPLQNNGGPTETQALLQGSPAIGKGNCPPPATDQRGVQRNEGECDIGAFQTADSDGDGIPDSLESGEDRDNDGIPNFMDTDSDNDGIPDALEAGKDPENPVDRDGDGIPNFLDTDSDNDGISDSLDGRGGGYSIASAGIKYSFPVYLLVSAFIVLRRVMKRYRQDN